MIPRQYEPVLFGLVLSGLMSWLVSGVSLMRTIGWAPDFLSLWGKTWLSAWLIAFPVVLIVAPLARRAVRKLIVND